MKDIRIGQGWDVHSFVKDRPLFLCGVQIPHPMGLQGHSDADAPLHALTDALLGALALGDIGAFFPDTDPKYKGADSVVLLQEVLSLEAFAPWEIGNIDMTITTEKPKLRPYMDLMRARLSEILHIPVEDISIKGKTCEKLGYIGRGEALEASAIVLLTRKKDLQ
jgi:2-C-methyl-D-erythritol 2,4-cyclodiphosphate synthase